LEQVTRQASSGAITWPRVSPDNRYVTVASLDGSPAIGLIDLSLPIEQRKVRRLAPPEVPDRSQPLGWLSDGRVVGSTLGDPKIRSLILFRVGDKSAISADGKAAYFVRTETVTNLWMIGK